MFDQGLGKDTKDDEKKTEKKNRQRSKECAAHTLPQPHPRLPGVLRLEKQEVRENWSSTDVEKLYVNYFLSFYLYFYCTLKCSIVKKYFYLLILVPMTLAYQRKYHTMMLYTLSVTPQLKDNSSECF